MANPRPTRRGLLVERLEARLVLSLSFGADSIELFAGDLAGEQQRELPARSRRTGMSEVTHAITFPKSALLKQSS